MDKQALRDYMDKREEDKPNNQNFPDVTIIGMKVGKNNTRTLKLLPWKNDETGFFFYSLAIGYVRLAAEKKTFPFKVKKGNPIDEVVKQLRKLKDPQANKLAYDLSAKETFLFHVMDLNDYQLKVLAIDSDGAEQVIDAALESTVDLSDIDNNFVIEVTKEMEQYTNKAGQVRNKRKYTLSVLEDENCMFTPKAKQELNDLTDLSTIYSAPSDEIAEKSVRTFLDENGFNYDDLIVAPPTIATATVPQNTVTTTVPETTATVAEKPQEEVKKAVDNTTAKAVAETTEAKVAAPEKKAPATPTAADKDYDDVGNFVREGLDE